MVRNEKLQDLIRSAKLYVKLDKNNVKRRHKDIVEAYYVSTLDISDEDICHNFFIVLVYSLLWNTRYYSKIINYLGIYSKLSKTQRRLLIVILRNYCIEEKLLLVLDPYNRFEITFKDNPKKSYEFYRNEYGNFISILDENICCDERNILRYERIYKY